MRLQVALVALLLVVLVPVGWAVDRAKADAAWARGDLELARALYEQILESEPGDREALFRSAQLHAWTKRFDDALERWERYLRLEPGDAAALRERAKTLSWAGRLGEAAAAFERILELDPDDRAARLGLARTLSWSGRQDDARREYRRLLEDDPDDVDAQVGVAQTLAWSGRTEEAREAYRRALALDEDDKAALMGLAYLDVWAGDNAAAREKIAQLEARHPDDEEVAELAAAERRSRAPWLRVGFDVLSDSDDNDRRISAVWWGRRLRSAVDVVAGAEHHDMSAPIGDASVTRIFGSTTWRPTRAWRVYARAGLDVSENTQGDTRTGGVATLSATRELADVWSVTGSLSRDTLIYSPAITDAEIEIDRAALVVEGRPVERWRVRGATDVARYSDDNERFGASVGAWRSWRFGRTTLEVGPVARWFDFSDDLDNGYFDPESFTSWIVQARARGESSDRRTYFDARLEAGVQSFTQGSRDVSGDGVIGGEVLAGRWVSPRVGLELYAAYSDYAVESATGFDFRRFGVRLRYRWTE